MAVVRALALCFALISFQGAFSSPSVGSLGAAECNVTDFKNVQQAVDNCQYIYFQNLTVPAKETLRLHLKSGTTVVFQGRTTFGYAEWAGPLVEINATNVDIEGDEGAVFDGQGALYWDGLGEWGSLKPKFFVIQLHRSAMRNIYVVNSPVHCVLLTDSTDVQLADWVIDNQAGDPESVGQNKSGHNTDGFDIFNGTNIYLTSSIVYNQDDCVAIRSGNNIIVSDLICTAGHGLSISVGFSNESFEQNTLENVIVRDSVLSGGENGIHIKTHVDGGFGYIKNVTYENIDFKGPGKYGINIQENYRNLPSNGSMPTDPKNNIPIANLNMVNITGSVGAAAIPVYILCADLGCFDWTFTNVLVTGGKNNSCNFIPNGFTC